MSSAIAGSPIEFSGVNLNEGTGEVSDWDTPYYESSFGDAVVSISGASNASPIQCPKGCGAYYNFKNETDHQLNCPKVVISCTYKRLGCTDMFLREDEEKHNRNCSSHHADLVKNYEKRFRELELTLEKVRGNLRKEEEKNSQQDETIENLRENNSQQDETIKKLREQVQQLEKKIAQMEKDRNLSSKFERTYLPLTLENFTEKRNSATTKWRSRKYTAKEGFAYCVEVYCNGISECIGKALSVSLVSLQGPNDDKLKWPLTAFFTLKLCCILSTSDHKIVSEYVEWERPSNAEESSVIKYFSPESSRLVSPHAFVVHDKIRLYLNNDNLNFEISAVLTKD